MHNKVQPAKQAANRSAPPKVNIREALLEELEKIHKIECLAYPHPWSLRMLETSLIGDHIFLVMEEDGYLIGHMIFEQILDELHLYNICVLPKLRRQGKGQFWLDHLFLHGSINSAVRIHLEVRTSNRAAQKLYLGNGFKQVGYRRNYYRSTKYPEDALVMTRP